MTHDKAGQANRGKLIQRDDPELCLYRLRTEYLLRKYARMSVEVGRLPSLLGREFFRTRVKSAHAWTFEDLVIFVHDVERSVEKLPVEARRVLARIALQEYSQKEAAVLLGCTRRTMVRMYAEALDDLSVILLAGGILQPFAEPPLELEDGAGCEEEAEEGKIPDLEPVFEPVPDLGNVCQEGKVAEFLVSCT
jgi:hypothetical protein